MIFFSARFRRHHNIMQIVEHTAKLIKLEENTRPHQWLVSIRFELRSSEGLLSGM